MSNPIHLLLDKLVAFQSVSSRTNLDLIDFVQDYLSRHGIGSARIVGADPRKANLWASIGPAVNGGIVLSGHCDVVPTEGQAWQSDPFLLSERGGRLYGRGTCDMKGFLACAIHAITAQDASTLERPIHLCLTHDEETDCSGIKAVVEKMGKSLPRPEVAIVGEPTSMKVVSGHKGVREFEVKVQGKSAHGSMPQNGVNAISLGAHAIAKLDEIGLRLASGPSQDSLFTPPHTTLNIGMAHGGTASNIIPDRFSFIGDIRAIPQDDPERLQAEFETWVRQELLPSVRRNALEAAVAIDVICDIPPFHPQIDSAAEKLVRRLTGDTEKRVVAFGSEAGILQKAGVSSVLIGPGSMEQGHTADEYVDVAQLEACRQFLHRLLSA